MRRRIYVDTSVVGGCLDEEFADASQRLFQRFIAGEDILIVSDLTRLEVGRAPEDVREVLSGVPPQFVEEVEFTDEARELADAYISAQVIGLPHRVDAQHIATATIHQVTVLASWNFKHVVNLVRIQGYNSVNLRHGYPLLEIRTPKEVLPYED
ncbi:MAG TPA: PIN domain protein [Thermoanaerobaculia bacterium]|jgi:predicted nucleic acid-binding protein|nr:PIN domain protein [Thermoanaerobaculia bacterium]